MLFLTAFITGLFGSFHCAGMCGPIAFALPVRKDAGAAFYLGRLVFQSGRLLTYSLLGLLVGGFGLGLKLAGLQQSVSISAGVIVILWAVLGLIRKSSFSFNPLKYLSSQRLKSLFSNPGYTSLFTIGLLNGLLPCGFVYLGLIGAGVTQNYFEGALFMLCFGLGTLPMMYFVSVAGQFLSGKTRSLLSKWSPFLAILIGCLFIVRGMGLGIPYISPKAPTATEQAKDCH